MLFRELETERLILKNLSVEDRGFLYEQFSNEEIHEYLFDAEPFRSITEADQIIEFYMQEEPRQQHRWVLVTRDGGRKIGTCGFHFWDGDECEVGYDLMPEFQGHGYMKEALCEIISFARSAMKVKRIHACIYPENENSIALAESCGFVFEGQKKIEVFRERAYVHHIYTLNFVREFWKEFLKQSGYPVDTEYFECFHFDNDERSAEHLLQLTLAGKKRATASSKLVYEQAGKRMPQTGDLSIVTDFAGEPKCVIKTTAVMVMPFRDMTFDMCKREGEDDSLESWQKNHVQFFTEEARTAGYKFDWDMPVVFEDFEVIYRVS